MDGAAVLAGPRGRRFCAEQAAAAREAVRRELHAGTPERLAALLDGVGCGADGVDLGEPALLAALADAVAFARYWEPPDEQDRLVADPRVVAALRPVADAVAASPAWGWWDSPLDRSAQAAVQWTGEHPAGPPRLSGATAGLREWRRETLADEQAARRRPVHPAAPWSGMWWSTPVGGRVLATSRARPGLGAVQLVATEDDLGWDTARVWPLRVTPQARVLEIDGPAAWADLVRRHPLEVSRSRRHDWWRATGRAGRWFVPDWPAVAADHDGVHLTVAAYLATAGRVLEVDGGASVLAGWDPDATLWLADVVVPAGDPAPWRRGADGRWRPGR